MAVKPNEHRPGAVGRYWRIQHAADPISPDWRSQIGSDEDELGTEKGTSVTDTFENLQQWARGGHANWIGELAVIEMEAEYLGRGTDGEPIVRPVRELRRIPFTSNRDALTSKVIQTLDVGPDPLASGRLQARSESERRLARPTRVAQEDDENAGPRGYVEFRRSDGKLFSDVVLRLGRADMSTALHELGHTFLEVFGQLAERPDAPAQVREDWATTLKHLGVERREDIKRAEHEKYARSYEAYLFTGKAPSARLARAFQRFSLWLRKVYRSIASLGVELSPEFRGVLDRMLATDAEIQRQQDAAGRRPLFRSPDEMGGTPEDFQAYLEAQERATAAAARATELRVLKDRLRESESWWQEEEAQLREAAEAEYEAQPSRRAMRFLRKGELTGADGSTAGTTEAPRLDRAAVVALVGEEGAKRFPGLLVKKGGTHPDGVAEMFGFPTGEALLKAALALPPKDAWARDLAAQRMREAYPGILEERQKLEEAVGVALHTDDSGDIFLRELRALRARTGQPMPVRDSMRRAAELLVERRQVRRLDVHQALVDERSAAEKAAVALAKGNPEQAVIHKAQQYVAHEMWRGLQRAREEREAFEGLLLAAADRKARGRLGQAGAVYRDAMDEVLATFGLVEREEGATGLGELLQQLEADGLSPAFDIDELRTLLQKPREWKDLTVGQMRNVRSIIKQVQHVAREANHVRVEGKAVELGELVDRVAAEAERLPLQKPPPVSDTAAGRLYDMRMWMHGYHAARRDPAAIIRKLGSTATKALWGGYLEARTREQELAKNALAVFLKAFDGLPKEMQERRYDLIEGLPMPEGVNLGGAWDRQALWMVAYNVGNDSNFDRLAGGYEWTREQVMEFLNKHMTKEEWTFIQGLWDLNDKHLYPLIEQTFERANGIKPPKIKATPVVTPHGVFPGGYAPARYNPKVSRLGRKQAESALQRPMGVAAASVAKGFTKERAKRYDDVISLSWSTVPGHLVETIRYVAYDQVVRDAAKVLKHGTFFTTVQQRMGEVYNDALDSWLKAVAGARTDHVAAEMRAVHQMLNLGKSMLVVKALGWNAANAMGDFGNPLVAAMAGKIPKRRMALTFAAAFGQVGVGAGGRLMGRPMFFPMREEALAKSTEMQLRADSQRARLRKEVERIGKRGKRTRLMAWREAAADTVFFFQETVAKLTDPVVWHSAYRDAQRRGLDEAAAVAHADDMLSQSTPSREKAEQPTLLRDQQMGAALVFHGYFNRLYQMNADVVGEFQERWRELDMGGKAAGSAAVAGQVLGVLFTAGAVGSLLAMKTPKEDEEWAEWLALQTASAGWAMFPWAGELGMFATKLAMAEAQGKEMKPDFSTRTMPALAGAFALRDTVMQVFKDGSGADKALDFLEATLAAINLPSGPPVRSARYLLKTASGEHQPQDAYEFLRGAAGQVKVRRD